MTAPTDVPPTQMLLRSQIQPSALNVRKDFIKEKIDELVESFREHGFKSSGALLVRRIPEELRIEPTSNSWLVQRFSAEHNGWETLHDCKTEEEACEKLVASARFEIIWGERRWHAAGVLGMKYVPAVVEEHSNLEAMELNMVENLARADLNAMEEAAGFRRLMDEKPPDGKPAHTPQSIAKRVGCSVMHVQDRLALYRLSGTRAEQDVIEGKLPPYHAVLIARLATPALREEVANKVVRPAYGPSPMPRPQLENLIRDEYQKELRGAKFDTKDEALLPLQLDEQGNRLLGGSCADCPFNSKNQEAGGRLWQCTNLHCFRAKEAAAFEKWRAESTDEAAARVALSAEENATLWDFNGATLCASAAAKYVDLEEKPILQDLKPGVDAVEPWKKLVAGQNLPVILARDGAGKERHLVARPLALSAAQQNGHEIFRTPIKAKKKDSADLQAIAEAEKLAQAREAIILGEQDARLREARNTLGALMINSEVCFLLLAQCLITTLAEGALASRAAENRGWTAAEKLGAEDYLLKYAKRLTVNQRAAFLFEMALALQTPTDKTRQAWAKALEVDIKAIRKACEERFAVEDKALAEKKNITEGLHWVSKKSAVSDFTWSPANVCENPDDCEVGMPAPEKITVIVKVARSEKGWHSGADVHSTKYGGFSHGASKTTTAYSSRELAVRAALLEVQEHLKTSGMSAALARIKDYLTLLGTSKKSPKKTPEEELAAKAGVKPPRKVKAKPKAKKAA